MDVIGGEEQIDMEELTSRSSLTMKNVFDILTTNWQNITTIVFKLQIREMGDARQLQTILQELVKKGEIEEKTIECKKNWRLK